MTILVTTEKVKISFALDNTYVHDFTVKNTAHRKLVLIFLKKKPTTY